MLINITCSWEDSDGPTSLIQLSHLRGSCPTLGQSTRTLPAAQHGRKGRKQSKTKQTKSHKETYTHTLTKRKINRQNPKINGKSKTKQTKSQKETYTHTLTKREKNKEERNQINKQTHT